MFEHFKATWFAGLRSNSFRVIGIFAVMLMLSAYLASTFSGRHPQTVAIDVGISGIRAVSILLSLFWMQELLGREIDRRTVYFALSYPTTRSAYLLGRYLGIVCMVAVAIGLLSISVYIVVAASAAGYHQAFSVRFGMEYLLTIAFVILDAAVIAGFTLMISSFASTSLLPLSVGAAFAIIARGYGPVLSFLLDKNGEGADIAGTYVPLIKLFGWFIPDLSQLDIRAAVMYGDIPSVAVALGSALHALSYLAIMLVASCLLFSRREFN